MAKLTVKRVSRDHWWYVKARHTTGKFVVGQGVRDVITVQGVNDYEGNSLAQFIAAKLNERLRADMAKARADEEGE